MHKLCAADLSNLSPNVPSLCSPQTTELSDRPQVAARCWENFPLKGTHLFQMGLGKGGTFCKIAKMQKPIPWHRYGAEKSWPELQEEAAGREPVVSSWRSYGCLIGMLDQVLTSVLRQL